MTIDETIQHEREVAQERRNIAKRFECVDNINIFIKCAEEHEQLAEWLEELKEYRDLEEQGLLLKLPCKAGDTVYIIDKRYTKCSSFDEEYSESSCWNCEEFATNEKPYLTSRYTALLPIKFEIVKD